MDNYIFHLINNLALKWVWLDFLGVFFAKYFEYFLWVAVLVIFIFNLIKKRRIVIFAALSAIVARFVIAEGIRFLWFRPRPFVVENVNLLVSQSASEASFPSGHASFYFALSTFLYLYNKKLGIVFFVASLLVCLGRVFVGIHWPSDILFGAMVGILTALVIDRIFKKKLVF